MPILPENVAESALGHLNHHENIHRAINDISDRKLSLERWWAGMANRQYSPAKWVAIGDSLTEGEGVTEYRNRWVDHAKIMLRQNHRTYVGNPDVGAVERNMGGRGILPGFYASTSIPNPYTSRSGTVTNDGTFGPGNRNIIMQEGSSITYNFYGDYVDVWYVQGSGAGTFNVNIDGGTVNTNVNANNAQLLDGRRWSSGNLGVGNHTIVITATTGPSYIGGIFVMNQDKDAGIQMYEMGHHGWTSQVWRDNPAYWPQNVATVQPHLVSIAVGANDYINNIPPATTESNINFMIDTIEANNSIDPAFLLISYPERFNSNSQSNPWQSFVNVNNKIALERDNVVHLDLTKSMSVDVSNELGYWAGDNIHQSNKGGQFIGDKVASFLSP